MRLAVAMVACLPPLTACAPPEPVVEGEPIYAGGFASLLAGDLLRVQVSMGGVPTPESLRLYTDCVASDEALFRGFSFARHVRTTVSEEAGLLRADAVYSVSKTLPAGIAPIDVATQAETCRDQGIPRV